MTYASPTGWLEPTPSTSTSRLMMFHTREDCAGIAEGAVLSPTERPLSARRCTICARVTDDE